MTHIKDRDLHEYSPVCRIERKISRRDAISRLYVSLLESFYVNLVVSGTFLPTQASISRPKSLTSVASVIFHRGVRTTPVQFKKVSQTLSVLPLKYPIVPEAFFFMQGLSGAILLLINHARWVYHGDKGTPLGSAGQGWVSGRCYNKWWNAAVTYITFIAAKFLAFIGVNREERSFREGSAK